MAKFGFDERRLFNISEQAFENLVSTPSDAAAGQMLAYIKADHFYLKKPSVAEVIMVENGSNVGAGSNLFKQKNSSGQLEFRSLISSDGTINFTQNADDIDITVDLTDINDELDHGLLQGLADDDHLQYFKVVGRANETLQINGTGKLEWSGDGAGQIGTSQSSGRPNNAFISTKVQVGSTALNDWFSQRSVFAADSSQQVFMATRGTDAVMGLSNSQGLTSGYGMVHYFSMPTAERNLYLAYYNADTAIGGSSLKVANDGKMTHYEDSTFEKQILLNHATTSHIKWNTDGGGDIGASLANRPNNVFIKNSLTIAALNGVLKASSGLVSGGATTTDLPEGTNLYFTDERAQDAVGSILLDSSEIDFTYDDGVPSISAVLLATTVVAGSYGSASQVGTFTVDAKGRLTAASSVSISITASQVSDFNEAAQDAVGSILTDSSSIDFTYNDAGNTISAVVLPGGVDHGGLAGLGDDDHTQYLLLAGRASGQIANGGVAASENLELRSTAHATKGKVQIIDGSEFQHSDNHKKQYVLQTTDAVVNTIATIPLSDDKVYNVKARLVCRRSDGGGQARGAWELRACAYRAAAGAATLQGAVQYDFQNRSSGSLNVDIDVSSNNMIVTVQGIAAQTFEYKLYLEYTESN